jgi:hypothetical protein
MKSAEDWHKERLVSEDCFNPEWIRKIQRDAFDEGSAARFDHDSAVVHKAQNSNTDPLLYLLFTSKPDLKNRP